MKISSFSLVCAGFLLFGLSAYAENIVLFSAAQSSTDDWIFGDARVKQVGTRLVIKEGNADGDFGDAVVADKLPFFSDAVVDFSVSEVSGHYTLQVLAFRGGQYVRSLDLVKNSKEEGRRLIDFKDFEFPDGTDQVMLKVWVGGLEGAEAQIVDLRYEVPVDSARVLLDKTIDERTGAEPDHAQWVPSANGGVITLGGAQDYGSVLLPDMIRMPAGDGGAIIVEAPEVLNGGLTVQLVLFDGNRDYLSSVNAITHTGAGFSAARFSGLSLPGDAAHFQIKLWISGNLDCLARVRRIVVLE